MTEDLAFSADDLSEYDYSDIDETLVNKICADRIHVGSVHDFVNHGGSERIVSVSSSVAADIRTSNRKSDIIQRYWMKLYFLLRNTT